MNSARQGALLALTRDKRRSHDILRSYAVILDGVKVGKIRRGVAQVANSEQGGPFRQITLSEEQIQAGLMESVDGLPIPSEPMAMMSIRAVDLGVAAGIAFQETFDDLDEGYFAILEFAGSFGVMLKDYSGSPLQGTRICTDPLGQHSRSRLEIILDALHLSRDQLIWTVEGLE